MAYSVFNQGLGSAVQKGAAALSTTLKTPIPTTTPKATTLAPIQGLGSSFAKGSYALTNAGSGGMQSLAAMVASGPTSYGAGSSVNTPTINKTIPVASLMSSGPTSSSTGYTAGTSPVLPSSAPSNPYNAANNNSQYGANGTTGLFETPTTNADGTVKITPVTGATTGQTTDQKLTGEDVLRAAGYPVPEKVPSVMSDYYNSDVYKAQQQAQQQMVNTQNQINAVTTRLNTDLANLRGVGAKEGVTEAVYGQQSSEVIREANNVLLPLQAQLAADQGNLKLATDTLDTWAKLRTEEVNQQQDYSNKIYTALYNIADRKQQAALDLAKEKRTQEFELKKLAIQFDYDKKLKSITAGGSGVTGDNTPLYQGLNSATATAVRGLVSSFKTEPLVTNFQIIQEGRNFAQSLSSDTKNPADDQALIYSLAKALDPDSVVREGEYATAQKYAQSWVKAYGKGVSQAIAGTGFLSSTARDNIKKTIETKYNSSKQSYNNVSSQYVKGINDLTGRSDGEKFIRSYVTPNQTQVSVSPEDNAIFNAVIQPVTTTTAKPALNVSFSAPKFNLSSFFK